MTPDDRKIEIMHRAFTSNVQRLTEDTIEMNIKAEKAIDQLKEVEIMITKYREYLATENRQVDWTLPKFILNIHDTIKKARRILEDNL